MGSLPNILLEQRPRLLLASTALLILLTTMACGNGSGIPGATDTPPGQNSTVSPGTGAQTPTENNAVRVEASVLELRPGATGTMEIVARNVPEPGLAGFTIDVFYDATVIELVSASAGDQAWSGLTSNLVQTGEARLVAARAEGVTGETVLAVLEIEAVGVAGEYTDVQLVLQDFADAQLTEIDAATCCGAVTIR